MNIDTKQIKKLCSIVNAKEKYKNTVLLNIFLIISFIIILIIILKIKYKLKSCRDLKDD